MSSKSVNSNTPDFWCNAGIGAGPAISTQVGKDCVASRVNIGIYRFTLAYGGIDTTNGIYTFSFAAAAGGFYRIVDVDDNIKEVTLTDSADAALEATLVRFGAWKGSQI